MNLTRHLHEAQSSFNHRYNRRNCHETKHSIRMRSGSNQRNTNQQQTDMWIASKWVLAEVFAESPPPSLSSHQQGDCILCERVASPSTGSRLPRSRFYHKLLRRHVERQCHCVRGAGCSTTKSCAQAVLALNRDSTTTLFPKQAVANQEPSELSETWEYHSVHLKDHLVSRLSRQ